MKIAISSTGGSLSAQIDPRFGRCAYFIIYDSHTGSFSAFSNPASDAAGGAGPGAVREISKRGAEAVLTGQVGGNAQAALEAAGIEVVTGANGTVQKALDAFLKNGR